MKIASFAAIAGLLAAVALPVFPVEKPSCQALETWASQLEKLPADYESFSQLTLVQRKAVYNRLSSAERAALWHRHWREALQQDGFTAEQKSLIAEAGRLVSADTLSALRSEEGQRYEEARAAVDAFGARAEKSFTKAAALALFYRLGTPAAAPAAGLAYYCYCNSGADDCEPGYLCDPSFCRIRLFGCGLFYEETCDGECFLI